ncbi:unnamed protein product [Triticum turgidum subsp. durum]|uniref:Uncharacterized protein n=1 Tax=Triticum turgidum subsp. durum TaxID=4567 RepID=A0A9R1Q7K6_TRITD|nr:unnamed protein product [Triticum turgidum subsp. durum]
MLLSACTPSFIPFIFLIYIIIILNGGIRTTIKCELVTLQMKALEKLISGTEIDLSELETRADQPKILKQYKITPQELSISTLPEAIVCRIAARDAL